MPQIDGLRCFAVLIVVWVHAGSGRLITFPGLRGAGLYGVWLFFTLSGFLITRILLRERDRMASGALALRQALAIFYTRRFLRIFPIYYGLLAVLAIANVPHVRAELAWDLSYLSNWMVVARQVDRPTLGHLWSLAVEEQFYLVWPLLILLVPRSVLIRVLTLTIVLAVMSRGAISLLTDSTITIVEPTTSNLDLLGLGALLAWHWHTHPTAGAERRELLRGALGIGLLCIAVTVVLSLSGRGFKLMSMIDPLGVGLVAVWMVDRCAAGVRGPMRRVLEARPVRHVGVISYGVYLYHEVLLSGLRHWDTAGGTEPATFAERGPLFFVIVLSTTIAAASLSWFAVERPLNALKRYVPY
jgi:peptidoglycan/LPS O-acetylase OafA/YrhL